MMHTTPSGITAPKVVADSITEVAARIDTLTAEKRKAFAATMDADAAEIATYQQTQAEAFAMQRVTKDFALWLHTSLSDWHRITLAERVVVTLAIKPLLELKVQGWPKQ